MSCEGEYQILCKNGHEHFRDIYDFDLRIWDCCYCGDKAIWEHFVDQTNGYPDCGEPIKLEILKEAEYCTCQCGNKHIINPPTYKIPKDKGNLIDLDPKKED